MIVHQRHTTKPKPNPNPHACVSYPHHNLPLHNLDNGSTNRNSPSWSSSVELIELIELINIGYSFSNSVKKVLLLNPSIADKTSKSATLSPQMPEPTVDPVPPLFPSPPPPLDGIFSAVRET